MAISYVYDFGRQLDLAKLKARLRMNAVEGDKNVLYVFMDPLFLVLFRDGRLRVVHKDRSVESLRKSLMVMGAPMRELVQSISKASGAKKGADAILATGDIESDGRIIDRPRLGGMGFSTFREISVLSPEKVLGAYQRERIATQAGEDIGRRLAHDVKDRQDLEKRMSELMKDEGLGMMSSLQPEKAEKIMEELQKPYALFRVLESTSYGMVPEGKPMCDLIRGMIRGAFCAYLNRENINVVETRCWGLGDVYCEFRVYLTKM